MDTKPKVDRLLLWLFERKPGDSKVKMRAKMVGVVILGTLVVLLSFQGVRWLAAAW